jgi:hypothetical protein
LLGALLLLPVLVLLRLLGALLLFGFLLLWLRLLFRFVFRPADPAASKQAQRFQEAQTESP